MRLSPRFNDCVAGRFWESRKARVRTAFGWKKWWPRVALDEFPNDKLLLQFDGHYDDGRCPNRLEERKATSCAFDPITPSPPQQIERERMGVK